MADTDRKPSVVGSMQPRAKEMPANISFIHMTEKGEDTSPAVRRGRRGPIKGLKKPYRTDSEREAELRDQPYTRKIEARRVLCGHCNTWVKLRNTTKYCPTPWYIHIQKCLKKNNVELVDWVLRTNRTVVPSGQESSDDEFERKVQRAEDDAIGDSDVPSSDEIDDNDYPRVKYENGEYVPTERVSTPVVRAPTPPWAGPKSQGLPKTSIAAIITTTSA